MNLLQTVFFLLAVTAHVNAERGFLRDVVGSVMCCGCKKVGPGKIAGKPCTHSSECDSGCCTQLVCTPCKGGCSDLKCAPCRREDVDGETEEVEVEEVEEEEIEAEEVVTEETETVVAAEVDAERGFLRDVVGGVMCCGCQAVGRGKKAGKPCKNSSDCNSGCCTQGVCTPCKGGCSDLKCEPCRGDGEEVKAEEVEEEEVEIVEVEEEKVKAGKKCCGCKARGDLMTGQSCTSSNQCESACCSLGKCNPCSGDCSVDQRCMKCRGDGEDFAEIMDKVAKKVEEEKVKAGKKCCGCKAKGDLKTGQACESSNECESACCSLGKCNPCSGDCSVDQRCMKCRGSGEDFAEIMDKVAIN